MGVIEYTVQLPRHRTIMTSLFVSLFFKGKRFHYVKFDHGSYRHIYQFIEDLDKKVCTSIHYMYAKYCIGSIWN